MYVCMHACVYACMFVCMHACMFYAWMYVRKSTQHCGFSLNGLREVPNGFLVQKLHCAPTRIHLSAKLDLMEWIVRSFPSPSCSQRAADLFCISVFVWRPCDNG